MNTSTQQITNEKGFALELNFIRKLYSLNQFEIKILGQEDIKAHISKKQEAFSFEINARQAKDDDDEISLSFIIDNAVYETKNHGNTCNGTELKADKSVLFQTTIEVKSFHSKDFAVKGLFKSFFAVDLSEIRTFHTQFETVTHTRDDLEYFYDCLRITLDERQYDVTQLKNEVQGFYIFECLQGQTYDDFSDACFSIQQAIGFITKLMVGGEKITFDEAGKVYYTSYIRPSIKGMYSPITTNPRSYSNISKKIEDSFFTKLTRISLENLSNLVYKIHYEREFSVAILVILEVTSIRSVIVIPSSFAVIIEQLSKHFSAKEVGSKTPIADNGLKNKIVKELCNVIDNNSDTLSKESLLKLKRRLTEINKPVNKQHLTNNEKLTRPFELLGIDLTLHDIAIIEHRNDLLHGNILLKSDENKDEEKDDLYMMYVSAKLFTLISKLILKSVGYNGYVYNQAKYLEKHINIETNEEYFEKI